MISKAVEFFTLHSSLFVLHSSFFTLRSSLPLFVRIGWQGGKAFCCRKDVVIIGIADDVSVAQFDVAAGIFGDIRVVGYEEDGSALSIELLEENQDLEAGSRIQITRCLVGENHGRIVHQRTGDGYTLHLSTRHLDCSYGRVSRPILQPSELRWHAACALLR